jgi:hypothetical protein
LQAQLSFHTKSNGLAITRSNPETLGTPTLLIRQHRADLEFGDLKATIRNGPFLPIFWTLKVKCKTCNILVSNAILSPDDT